MLRPLVIAAGAGALGLRAMHVGRHWGATAEEVAATLPGDELEVINGPGDMGTARAELTPCAPRLCPWVLFTGGAA